MRTVATLRIIPLAPKVVDSNDPHDEARLDEATSVAAWAAIRDIGQ